MKPVISSCVIKRANNPTVLPLTLIPAVAVMRPSALPELGMLFSPSVFTEIELYVNNIYMIKSYPFIYV